MKRALIAICMLSLIGGAATWAVAGDAKAPDKPIELKSSEHKKMWVKFNHATHESVECDVCHHAAPSDAKDAYVSCGASEECHSLKGIPRACSGRIIPRIPSVPAMAAIRPCWDRAAVRATCLPRAAEPKESKLQSVCCPAGRDPAGQFFLEPGRLPGAGMRA